MASTSMRLSFPIFIAITPSLKIKPSSVSSSVTWSMPPQREIPKKTTPTTLVTSRCPRSTWSLPTASLALSVRESWASEELRIEWRDTPPSSDTTCTLRTRLAMPPSPSLNSPESAPSMISLASLFKWQKLYLYLSLYISLILKNSIKITLHHLYSIFIINLICWGISSI